MWALITLIVLSLLGLGIALGKHGEPKGDYNYTLHRRLFCIADMLHVSYQT